MNKQNYKQLTKTAVILAAVFVVWFILDRISKLYFDSGQFLLGQKISPSILNIFHLTLVHNTGAAFGIFGNATIVLGIISTIISIVLLALPFIFLKMQLSNKSNYSLTGMQLFSVAIIAAGGIGNAIDRFITGYVVDFICFDFIDFPVFNIADIGVTCGIVILLITMFISSYKTKEK